MALDPLSLMGGSPSFQSSASSAASAKSGDITSGFYSGEFNFGNSNKDMTWIFLIIGAVVAVFFIFKAKKA